MGLELTGAVLDMSVRSLCHANYNTMPHDWIVYAGTSRYPFVNSVTPVPHNMACCFSYFTTSWDRPDVTAADFARCLAAFLNGASQKGPEEIRRAMQPDAATMPVQVRLADVQGTLGGDGANAESHEREDVAQAGGHDAGENPCRRRRKRGHSSTGR